jgi:hypothetical protein
MLRNRAIAVLAAVAAVLAFASPAHAQNKGSDYGPRIDTSITFAMNQYWNFVTSSQYYTGKGAIECPRCGKFIVKMGLGDKIDSIKLKKTSNEKIVSAYYRYFAFDGFGFDSGKSKWSGLTRLPAQTTLTDVEGAKHNVVLIDATVNMRERKPPYEKKGALPPSS